MQMKSVLDEIAYCGPARLLVVVNSAEFFLSHRLRVALEARKGGFEVHIATPPGQATGGITAAGFIHHEFALSRSGRSMFAELDSLVTLCRLFRKLRPDIVHLVTIKPVLYGGIAAQLTGVPSVVAAVSGLGFVFLAEGSRAAFRRAVVGFLYRCAFRHKNLKVIFQNDVDRHSFLRFAGLELTQTELIRGSGVEISDYPVRPLPQGVPAVVMAARLLVDKGVREFVQAARLLRSRGIAVTMRIAGAPDEGNPTAVTAAELAAWQDEGIVDFLGHRSDMAAVMADAHIVALPSYREGLPKALIEAAASGRAVVTTDVPGCRDAIEPGVTGLLVPAKDARALADAIATLVADPLRCQEMGAAGRILAEAEFDVSRVANAHLKIYRELQAHR